MKRNLFIQTVLAFGVVQASVSHAGAFHTIIGPDGRPIVVQLPDQILVKKPTLPLSVQKELSPAALSEGVSQPELPLDSIQKQKVQQVIQNLDFSRHEKSVKQSIQNSIQHQQSSLAQPKSAELISPRKHAAGSIQIEPVNEPITVKASQHAAIKVPAVDMAKSATVQHAAAGESRNVRAEKLAQKKKASSFFQVLPQALLQKPAEAAQPIAQSQPQPAGFSAMGGEQYVNSEYLEDKEFNLDGKKRFYAMPEGVIDSKVGSARMQMVEREKGISKSMLDSIFKHNQPVESGPVTLSAAYYRVSKDDAAAGLGQQCFQEKKISKAKKLKPQSELNIWPRAPLNDAFDFEVIRVENAIQNIQIYSYASKQNNPTFYWPFAVFLDIKGCVLEGAGGYKNKDSAADALYRERIEGVIQVPNHTAYILLTPLATAVDVEQRALTNHGQLKLIAIR